MAATPRADRMAFPLAAMLTCLAVLPGQGALAADVDKPIVKSSALSGELPLTVVKPAEMRAGVAYPTIYFLHGAKGSAEDWLGKTGLSALVDKYGFIAVLPDGGKVGWYLDSPLVPQSQYDSAIAKEVVPYVDSHYPTIADHNARRIALSWATTLVCGTPQRTSVDICVG